MFLKAVAARLGVTLTVATYDRFLKLRAAAQEMAVTASQERGRQRKCDTSGDP